MMVGGGPVSEQTAQIAGFNILACAGLDEALEVASKNPGASFGILALRPIEPWALDAAQASAQGTTRCQRARGPAALATLVVLSLRLASPPDVAGNPRGDDQHEQNPNEAVRPVAGCTGKHEGGRYRWVRHRSSLLMRR
jgi:YCII-related domain